MPRKGKANVLTQQEFKRVESITIMHRHAKRNKAMLYLSFGLGLRACEIRDLKLGDVLENDWKTLKETVNLYKTKGDKPRKIFLTNKKLCSVLMEHIEQQKKYMENKRIPLNLERPLFLSQKGNFFFTNQIVMIMGKMFRDAGIHGAKSHSGRATFITNKIDEGYDIVSISELVGHSNITQTRRYHQSNPTRLKKISEKSIFN